MSFYAHRYRVPHVTSLLIPFPLGTSLLVTSLASSPSRIRTHTASSFTNLPASRHIPTGYTIVTSLVTSPVIRFTLSGPLLVTSYPLSVLRLVKSLSLLHSHRSLSYRVPIAESPRRALHVPPHHVPTSLSPFVTCLSLFVMSPLVSRDRHISWSRLPNLLAAQAWALRRGLPEVLRGDASQVPLSYPFFKIVTSPCGDAAQIPLSYPLFKIVTFPWRRRRPGAVGPLAGGRLAV